MRFPKYFLMTLIINICILIAYEAIYANDLLNFAFEAIHPNSMILRWSPFLIEFPFAAERENYFADGIATMPNYTFFILIGMICFNLVIIWKLEQRKPESKVEDEVADERWKLYASQQKENSST